MIYFNQISKHFLSGHPALSDINFSLCQGELAFLTGHSGAGKTTMLKLIALLERPSSGEIIIDGHPIHSLKKRAIPYLRQKIGLIFQQPHLLMNRTVFDNVALPLIICRFPSEQIPSRVRAALDKVGLLGKEKAFPTELSCGEEQRIGIARAIVHRPKILLADEPTGNLDPELSLEIMQLFQAFQQLGITILIATHDLELIAPFRYRHLVLKQGHLVHDGGPQ